MYVHIGDDIVIRTDQIIAILDKKMVSAVEELELLFNDAIRDSATIIEKTKSIIITREQIYFSSIAPLTLKKRID